MMIDIPDKIAFVDLETTGGRVTYDRIIEVGIIRVEQNKVVGTYQSLVNPQMHVPPFIQTITNIPVDELEYAPPFSDIKHDVFEILEGCVFVAHNVRFDYGFLRQEFNREEITFTTKHLCTARLSKYLFPDYRKHNLDAIIDRFRISCQNRHRAFDDAKVLWDFFSILQKEIPSDSFSKALHFVLRSPSIPLNLPLDVLESLPESPGVYIFYGENNAPLYVGKSKNIKERVMSHFANDHLSTKEMKLCQQVQKIESIPTAGELGALLKESNLIKKLQPLYNRALRFQQQVLVLKKELDDNGYIRLKLELLDRIDPKEIEEIISVYKSKKQAKQMLMQWAHDYGLCMKLLGLEKTDKACFGYHLKQCKGACIGKESALMYNVRLIEAIGMCKIKPWPFRGAVSISESSEINGMSEEFIVDKWCLLGMRNELSGNEFIVNEVNFDWDTYKILTRYFKNHNHLKHIKYSLQLSNSSQENDNLSHR